MKAESIDRFPVWFKSEKTLYVYVVFPGQQIFMSGVNLGKLLKPNVVHGFKTFQLDIQAKVLKNIPSDKCQYVVSELNAVVEAHKTYELW